MPRSKVQLPEGVRDIIGLEAYAKRRTEQQAREAFLLCGYQEIETPTFEYATVFDGELGDLRFENMMHFFDADGRMLTMRPDFTLPCARVVSALRDSFPTPVRVFYIGNAFGLEHNTGHQRREFSQAGAELMGLGGAQADAEIIMVAHQVLENMGLTSYVLDLGHVGVFKALWKAAGLSRTQADALRGLLDQKNELEALDMLNDLRVEAGIRDQLLKLIDLYGGIEVLSSAREALGVGGCQKALDELESVCQMLGDCGLTNRITIDLGHLTNMDYYTGTVFCALAEGVGSPLLSGGRYDGVLAQFGRPMPATGFAVSVSRVVNALENKGAWASAPPAFLLGANERYMGAALCQAAILRQRGQVVITAVCSTEKELYQRAGELGVMRVLYVDENGVRDLNEGEIRP